MRQVVAEDHVVLEDDAGIEAGPCAELHPRTEHHMRPDGHSTPEFDAGPEPGRRVEARHRDRGRVQPGHHLRQCAGGIGDHHGGRDGGRLGGQLLRDEHNAGGRILQLAAIRRGHHQRQVIRPGAIERRDRPDEHRPIAKQAAADEVGDRLRGESGPGHLGQLVALSFSITRSVRSRDRSAATMFPPCALTSKMKA